MKRYYIGIDIGGTNTRVALLGKKFNIIKKVSFPTFSYKGPQKLIQAITDSILDILKKHRLSINQIFGIGIGIAGLVDAGKGTIHNLINIPGWKGINIKRLFKKRLKIPTYIDNDTNVMTLAELYRGAGKKDKNLICITLGTGVGGGIVIEGKLYRGSTSSAGEIGHTPINEKGPRCNCGGIACIESYVGNRYLINELKRRLRSGEKTLLKKLMGKTLSNLTPQLVDRAARLGDRFAIDFWKEVGTRIGIMLSGVVNLLNPDKVVIGGGIANAGRFLFSFIRKTVKARAMDIQGNHVKIVKAKLGKDAGLIGAAILVSLEKNK